MIIISDFNIDMFDSNSTQPNELQSFMDQYTMKLQLKNITTIYGSQIDHIQTNAPTQHCILRVVKVYWIDHKQYILRSNSQLRPTITSYK
jgi:hypothetical protein